MVMRVLIFLLSAAAVLLLNLSCATDITGRQVSSLEITVRDGEGEKVSALLPNRRYELQADAVTSSGSRIGTPDHRGFMLSSARNLQVIGRGRRSITLRTGGETFHPAGTRLYALELAVRDNPFPGTAVSFPLRWEGLRRIDYRGADGRDGGDGRNAGSSGGRGMFITARGEDGQTGEDGKDGEDLRLAAARYRRGGTERLLFYDLRRDRLFLTAKQRITVDTSGGSGGDGGDGGRGYQPDVPETPGGSGIRFVIGFAEHGTGGAGGDGGDAGDLTVIAADASLLQYIETRAAGGSGGRGGHTFASPPSRGGEDGENGEDGRVRRRLITGEKLRKMLEPIDHPGFEAGRLIVY
jgi:hypothetical protein